MQAKKRIFNLMIYLVVFMQLFSGTAVMVAPTQTEINFAGLLDFPHSFGAGDLNNNGRNDAIVSNSATISKNLILKDDSAVQRQGCIPDGTTMWVNGTLETEIAAQVQQKLEQIEIDAIVEARNYGEVDSCGTYNLQGIDFTVTLLQTELSNQAVSQDIINDILPILIIFGKPNLGNVRLIDSLGKVLSVPANDTSLNNIQTPDSELLPPDAVFKKVYVIVYDPLLSNGQKLSEYEHWNDHTVITQQTIDFFKQASNNKLNYTVADTTVITSGWPELADGFSYTESGYLAVLAGQQSPHSPTGVNYNKIVNSAEFDICGKLNRGEIDEVWIYNGPWFGFYESTLVGPGAYYFNSPPVSGSHGCNRLVPIMGPSVERTVYEAVHNFTHRTESTMTKVYGSWQENNTSHGWNKFALTKAQSPNYSYSGCGNGHYPPNGTADYDYGNPSTVLSNCNDFANYPNLDDPLQVSQPVTCSIWGCTQLGYFGYWFGHLPSNPGCGPDNVANDWWNYFVNPAVALYPSNACQSDMHIISGNVGMGDIILTYMDGIQKSVAADSYGNYFLMVSNQWSGTIIPSRDGGYTFSPVNRSYTDVEGDVFNQSYTAVLNGPEISIKGNNILISDGDAMPSLTDYTDFGVVAVEGGAVSHIFTIYNTGVGDLNLTDSPKVTISGPNASDFSVTVLPLSPITPSGSTPFTITFDPSADGLRTASISIANDDTNENPYNFSIQGLAGNYPEMEIKGNAVTILDGDSTPSLTDYTNFGSTSITNGSISRTFTIYNSGNGDLNLTDLPKVAVSGSHAGDFSVTIQPSSPIAPSGSTTFTIIFDPSASGLRTASVSIVNNDSDENPYNFSVQGTGTASPEIDIQGNNTSIPDGDITPSLTDFTDFGVVSVTGGTTSHAFTIYNTGDANLTLTGSPSKVYVFGTNSSDFTVSTQPSTPIVPGGMVTFTVIFNPSASGIRNASIYVYSDDSNENPYDFSIRGTGAPTVLGIIRADANPTNAASVNFTVTFSESVINVDTSDFALETIGITGASITGVTGSGATRTVSVNTGSGSGTIRLDIPATATITNLAGIALNELPYNKGEIYTNEYALTINKVGNGTITANISAPYHYNDIVQLTPTANTGWTFTGWSGACTGTDTCTITMNDDKSLTATFTQNEYTLTINSANGAVTKNPDKATYHEGDVVQLSATPATGWRFSNWTSGLISSVNPDSVTIHNNTSITANYTQNEYTLTVTSANGAVAKNPNKSIYHEGDVVQLTATPNTGWSFANWTGNLSGSVNPDSVTIHSNTSITANYIQNGYSLTITSASGTVARNPDQATYHEGDVVQLTATPNNGWAFANWTGALTSSINPDLITIHGNTAVTANYTVFPEERSKNGGFETYKGTTKIPTSWVQGSFGALDGKNTTKKFGKYAVSITGAAGKTKTLTQTLTFSGAAGDTFTFSFWAKGASIPTTGVCQAQVLLYNGTKLVKAQTVNCKTGTYATFQKKTATFNATAAYTKVVIKFTYAKASGTIWFDGVSLMR